MESGPVCRLGNRPRMLVCYLCGREYGSKSLAIHIPQCQRKWLMEEEQKPKNERRALPPQPNAERAIGTGGARAFDNFNVEAYAAFEQTLEQCPYCQRRFLPKPFKTHQKGCTAAKPAKPAGTGLIQFSLTNRLVPGAVAGSMHGKAKKQPMPLHLCRPPPKLKPKLKSTQRPAWMGARGSPFDDTEDGQLPCTQHKTSAQEWCLQAETNFFTKQDTTPAKRLHKNSISGSKNSFKNKNGTIKSAQGETANQLVTKFGEIWRTQTRDAISVNLPTLRTHPNRKSGAAMAREWFVPATEMTTTTRPSRNSRQSTKSHAPNHILPVKQSAMAKSLQLRPSHLEQALDFVALAKTLPKPQHGEARSGELRQYHHHHHRRSPGFS